MRDINISTMLFTWNGVGDRFMKTYFEPVPAQEVFPRLAGTRIKGVELQHPNHVNEENMVAMRAALENNGLVPVIVNTPMASDMRWKKGSFSHPSAEVRAAAVTRVKQAMDASRALGCNKISVFLGQDGFDYPMVSNYQDVWKNMVDCFTQCARYAPEVDICIEYKPREPRTNQYLSTAAKTILLCEETGCVNVGLLVDIGHAWMAGENMGETLCLAAHKNRLFHVHLNDNEGVADDDLAMGGIHLVQYLEALYWLDECDYDGWISFDVHSPREESAKIILESAELLENLHHMMGRIGKERFAKLIASYDGCELIRFFNQEVFTNLLK